jgi:hypothetical protein
MIFEHDPRVVMGLPAAEGEAVELREVTYAPEPAAQLSR